VGCLRAFPYGHWKTMTFLAALRCACIDTPCVFDSPINGLSFMTYVEQFLVPTLRPGDIVILDNAPHAGGVRHATAQQSTKERRFAAPSALPEQDTRLVLTNGSRTHPPHLKKTRRAITANAG
jgi:hypothetical protein